MVLLLYYYVVIILKTAIENKLSSQMFFSKHIIKKSPTVNEVMIYHIALCANETWETTTKDEHVSEESLL